MAKFVNTTASVKPRVCRCFTLHLVYLVACVACCWHFEIPALTSYIGCGQKLKQNVETHAVQVRYFEF